MLASESQNKGNNCHIHQESGFDDDDDDDNE